MTPEEWQEFVDWQEFKEFLEFREFMRRKNAPAEVVPVEPPPVVIAEIPAPPTPPRSVPDADPALLVSWVTDEVWIEHDSGWDGPAFVCWGRTPTRTAVGRILVPGPVLFRLCMIASDKRSSFGMGLIEAFLNKERRPKMPPAF